MFDNDENTSENPSTSGAAATPTAAGDAAAGARTAAPAAAGGTAPPAANTSPAATPAPTQQGSAAPPAPSGHGMLHGILDALGGTTDVQYERTPDGKMVATHVKMGPGQQWKRIIAGGLTGAAAAAQTKPGPDFTARATGAGVNAGFEMAEKQDDKKREHANEDFEASQQAMVRKAQIAKLNMDVSTAAFGLARNKVNARFEDSARENELTKSIAAGGMGSTDLGVANTFDDVLKLHKEMPDLAKQQAQGNVIGIPHVNEQGQYDGMRYALVTPEWKNSKTSQDETFFRLEPPTKPGAKPQVTRETVKAGSMTNGDFWTARMAAEKPILDMYGEEFKQGQETNRTKLEQSGATTRTAMTQAGEDRRAVEANKTKENVAAGKYTRQDLLTHDKTYVKPANDVEKSYQMMDRSFQEYQAAAKQGKELPTGAQSMLALSQHLSTTFGNVKGARVTKDLIKEHLGARSVSDSALVAIQRLTNGDQLSKNQWDAFHSLIGESRRLSWETAVKEAKRKDLPLDFLPQDLNELAGQGGGGGSTAAPGAGVSKTLQKYGAVPLTGGAQ